MPAASVKPAEVHDKIVFEEHPAAAGFGRPKATLPRVAAQDRRRHPQERSGFAQVERAHGLLLGMVVQPDVVAAGLRLGLAADVVAQPLGELPRRVVVVRLHGV